MAAGMTRATCHNCEKAFPDAGARDLHVTRAHPGTLGAIVAAANIRGRRRVAAPRPQWCPIC
jgi:hypothetical protein